MLKTLILQYKYLFPSFHVPKNSLREAPHQSIKKFLHNFQPWEETMWDPAFQLDSVPCPCAKFRNKLPDQCFASGHVAAGLEHFAALLPGCSSITSASAASTFFPGRSHWMTKSRALFDQWLERYRLPGTLHPMFQDIIPITLSAFVLGVFFVDFATHEMMLLCSRAWKARQKNGGKECWIKFRRISPDGTPGACPSLRCCREAQYFEMQKTVRQRTDYYLLLTVSVVISTPSEAGIGKHRASSSQGARIRARPGQESIQAPKASTPSSSTPRCTGAACTTYVATY